MKSDNNCNINIVYFTQIALFFRLDQPVRMRSPRRMSQNTYCFYSNRDFYNDALTLPI